MMDARFQIGLGDSFQVKTIQQINEQAGFDTVVASTGRDALRRLNQGADIDVIWVNHELHYPMLRDFLSQARTDYRYGKLPMFVVVAEDGRKAIVTEVEFSNVPPRHFCMGLLELLASRPVPLVFFSGIAPVLLADLCELESQRVTRVDVRSVQAM